MTRRLVLIATMLAAIVGPATAHADPPESCFNRSHPTFARLVQPSGGVAQVNTTPTGTLTVATGGPTPAVFLSTTGTIQVEIDQACLLALKLTVTKVGDAAPIHTRNWEPACGHATVWDTVEIGLDAGEFRFQLTGQPCNGGKVVEDGNGGFVADPPLA